VKIGVAANCHRSCHRTSEYITGRKGLPRPVVCCEQPIIRPFRDRWLRFGTARGKFQDRCLQPLGHPSAGGNSIAYARNISQQSGPRSPVATGCHQAVLSLSHGIKRRVHHRSYRRTVAEGRSSKYAVRAVSASVPQHARRGIDHSADVSVSGIEAFERICDPSRIMSWRRLGGISVNSSDREQLTVGAIAHDDMDQHALYVGHHPPHSIGRADAEGALWVLKQVRTQAMLDVAHLPAARSLPALLPSYRRAASSVSRPPTPRNVARIRGGRPR
jgi:hypothetical protein